MTLTTEEMAQACGVSKRQLDYWQRAGWAKPARKGGNQRASSGVHWVWPETEVPIIRNIALLVAEGLTVARSAAIARYGDPDTVLALLGSQPESGDSR
jgi:MerR HTH family regulatory protein